MDNLYEKFDKLLSVRANIVRETAENIELIKSGANPDSIKYSTAFDGLGPLCPSLIIDKLTGGYKKGRLLSKKPKSSQYAVIYYDKDSNPLYVEKYNQYGCELTYCFWNKDGVIWVVPFVRTSNSEYPTYVHRMVYENGRISEYTYMTANSLNHEEYTYTENPDIAICDEYYYVPHMSQKGRKMNGGNLSVHKNNITLQKGKVVEIKHFDVIGEKEILTFTYSKT